MMSQEQQASVIISFTHEVVVVDADRHIKTIKELPAQFGYWDTLIFIFPVHENIWKTAGVAESEQQSKSKQRTEDWTAFGNWLD